MVDLATRLEQATEETCYDAIADFVNGYCDERVRVTLMDHIGDAERMKLPALLLGVVAACAPDHLGYGLLVSHDRVESRADMWGAETVEPFKVRGAIPACALAAAIVRATCASREPIAGTRAENAGS